VLGIHDGQTAALVDRVGRAAALLPSFEHAHREVGRQGVGLSAREVHRIACGLGAQVLSQRKRQLMAYRAGCVPAGGELAGKRVAACIDGGRTRLRRVTRKQRGKGKSKKQRRRYKADWREVKLLIVYEIDKDGKKVPGGRPWIDGTFAGPDEAMELLAYHLHRLGAARAEVVVFLADGGPWIWERFDWVARRVGLPWRRRVFVLDFYHAAANLGAAVEKLPLPEAQRRRLSRNLRKRLHRGEGWGVVQELRQLGSRHGVSAEMEQPVAYLERHEDECHLDYEQYGQRGLPTGSGAVESAIRRVINLRIKGAGIIWGRGNAEAMVVLRAAALSERWEETMTQVREGLGRDRRIDTEWTGPDMRAELQAGLTVEPPTTQVQTSQPPARQSA
jgi:hypothetical protein